MGFKFSRRSEGHLKGVHPDLVRVVRRALEISPYDFAVLDGLRSLAEQKKHVLAGASKTMHSRHLTGHAIDFAAVIDGVISWRNEFYKPIADAFFQASEELKIPIVWGGNWASFKDEGHIELDRRKYPG